MGSQEGATRLPTLHHKGDPAVRYPFIPVGHYGDALTPRFATSVDLVVLAHGSESIPKGFEHRSPYNRVLQVVASKK